MKPGDLVMISPRPWKAHTTPKKYGVFIKFSRSHGSFIYYDVLVDGEIKMVDEDCVEAISETR